MADRAFKAFRRQQTQLGGSVTAADKAELRGRLRTLDQKLDTLLARRYGVQPSSAEDI